MQTGGERRGVQGKIDKLKVEAAAARCALDGGANQ